MLLMKGVGILNSSNGNFYVNDYFDFFNLPFSRNREYMKTDIYEKGNKYVFDIDLPGLKKENICINYENGYLTIRVRKDISKDSYIGLIRKERFFGEAKRSFYIGLKRESDIKAVYKEGILNISFPKEEQVKTSGKNIAIE